MILNSFRSCEFLARCIFYYAVINILRLMDTQSHSLQRSLVSLSLTFTNIHTQTYTPTHTNLHTHTHPFTNLHTHPFTNLHTHPFTNLHTHFIQIFTNNWLSRRSIFDEVNGLLGLVFWATTFNSSAKVQLKKKHLNKIKPFFCFKNQT